MNMTSWGGYLILHTPANNLCGHGFYQFSPELFFSVLNEANGFQILDITAIASVNHTQSSDQFFQLDINHKGFISKYPVNLHVCAKRIGEIPSIDKAVIQQSDYLKVWDNKLIFDEGKTVLKIKSFLRKNKFLYETARRFYHAMKKRSQAAGQYDINKVLEKF